MSSRACATGHMKDPMPLIEKGRGLSPGGRFPPGFIHRVQLRVYLCGADTDTVWNKHVENLGPGSTCADTDTATHPAPHAAISEQTLQSSRLAAVRVVGWVGEIDLQPDR